MSVPFFDTILDAKLAELRRGELRNNAAAVSLFGALEVLRHQRDVEIQARHSECCTKCAGLDLEFVDCYRQEREELDRDVLRHGFES